MTRRNYLIAYDISDDKRRTRVFDTLKDYGDHVQFSVFLCALSPIEIVTLRGLLSGLIDARADQVIILNLGDVQSPLENILDCLGQRYNSRSKVQVV